MLSQDSLSKNQMSIKITSYKNTFQKEFYIQHSLNKSMDFMVTIIELLRFLNYTLLLQESSSQF